MCFSFTTLLSAFLVSLYFGRRGGALQDCLSDWVEMSSNEALLQIFVGTLSDDKNVREQAEAALTHVSADPWLIIRLIHFSCQELPLHGVPAETRQALHAASIRVRNVLGRSDWNRHPYFTEETKQAVRECIVPLQCGSHVPELVRRQLLAATQELIHYDYPHRWPSLMPHLRVILDECVVGLRVLPDTASSRETATLRLKGAVGILRACCKVYEDAVKIDADAIEKFINNICPSLLSLTETLASLWVQELVAQQQSHHMNGVSDSSSAAASLKRLEPSMFVVSPWHTELSHCLRIALKCIDSLLAARWPLFLCDQSGMDRLCKGCIGQVLDATHTTLLPLYRSRIPTGDGDDSDLSSVFYESAVWKLLKWVENLGLKLLQALSPKSCERRARAAAKYFCDHYLLGLVQHALDFVRWHTVPRRLTSKAYIMSLEILTMAVGGRETYRKIIAPNAEEIFTMLIFPRLTFSVEDAELWASNPAEYVRLQTSPAGDLYSAKVVSSSLMLSLTIPSKPFHDTEFVNHVVQYVLGRLIAHAAAAAHGDVDAARVVDAAFFTIYQFNKVLHSIGFGDEKVEWLLTNYVAPAAKYPVGFLRARSVLVLSVFAPKIHWSSPQAFQRVLVEVLPLLQDPDIPVRIQTCMSFANLICHPHARDVVTPCLSDVIQHYFCAMRLMDSEGVVRTLRKTIKHYRDVLSQWALHLTELLVQHFYQVLERALAAEVDDFVSETFANKKSGAAGMGVMGTEEDGVVESVMAADEILETLTVLVRAIPQQPVVISSFNTSQQRDLIFQMQERIAPMLYMVLSKEKGGCLGFMDASLMLLTTMLSRSSAVASFTWRLLPCLHQIVVQGAVDYFSQMLPPLDNFACVSPEQFLLFPMSDLCAMPEFAVKMASTTPAQVVCTMCDAVMQSCHILCLRELAAVPKIYDSILQNLWQLKQRDGNHANATAATDNLVEYIIQTALRVLTDPNSQKKRRRTLTLLFANNIFSAILANAELTVRTLSAAGTLLPFFAHYVQLVQGETMQTVLRSYDRRLFIMAIAVLARLQAEQAQLATTLDEVLCGVVKGEVLACFSHSEGVLVAMEVEGHTRSGDEHDEEEWSMDESSDSGEDDDDDDEDEEDYDDDLDDDADSMGSEASALAGDSQLQALLMATAATRKRRATTKDIDDEEEEEEEDNLLDENDFVSPIDACNAWAFLLESVNHTTAVSSTRFCQLVRDANSQQQMQSLTQMSALMEQLLATRGRRRAAATAA
ncbi:importin-7 [Trypanosoma rangeli]|uniref:Importin-7 n=1 Tax=Trypanosoma rangeli TaxID=5698 RepID=A0A3R7KJJ9_TRYRA|nr:importin-7 [Trypanosoma rangeli]RNF07770.1 importin-7 [Trypanosoma rangeli]|eukprot:RNF07770.1 importin-7 [Trypanosoma rangeli]